MNRRRKWTITLAAAFVGLLGLEATARLAFADDVDTARLREQQQAGALGFLLRPSADPRIFFELRRGLDLRVTGTHIVTDAEGCRVRTEPAVHLAGLPADGEPCRVAVVGASSSFGHGVREEQAWPETLVPFLESRWQRPVTLRNFSTPSWNSAQQAADFEQRVLPWRPEVVLWHYDHRDAFPALDVTRTPELPPEYGDNPLGSAALKLARRWLRQRELCAQRSDGRGDAFSDDGYILGGPDHERQLAALHRAGELARAAGVPLLLVVFDAGLTGGDADRRHAEQLHAPLVPELQADGFHVVDLLPDFERELQARGWPDLRAFWRDSSLPDPHPNLACHGFIASAVVRALQAHPDWLQGPSRPAGP